MIFTLFFRLWVLSLLVILSTNLSCAAEPTSADKLFKAVNSKNIAEVKRLLDEGADPNVVAKIANETPIFRAVYALDYDTAVLLLDRGASVDHKDIAEMNVLTAACNRLDFKASGSDAMRIVRMLVERGAKVNMTPPPAGKSEDTSSGPLHSATSNGKTTVELLQFLISKGANVNQPMRSIEKSLDGVTPLMNASMLNSNEIVEYLLKNGADVNARSAQGDSAIRIAFFFDIWGDQGRQALLFKYGAVLTTDDKQAVLMPIFSNFHEEIKKRLGEVHGALCTAVAKEPTLEKADMEQLLAKAGVSDDRSEFSVVSAQCVRGSCDVVMRHLIKYADHCTPLGDLKACAGRISGPAGKTVITMSEIIDLTIIDLHTAIKKHDLPAIKRLLDQGADPNGTTNKQGESMLYQAVMEHYLDAVTLLLDRGARVDQTDVNGSTVLNAACFWLDFRSASEGGADAMKIIRLLIDRGADVNAASLATKSSSETWTPLNSALGNSKTSLELIKLLVSKGANVTQPLRVHPESSDYPEIDGVTPLMIVVVSSASREIIGYLLDQGAELDARSTVGYTAIMHAFTADITGKDQGKIYEFLSIKGARLPPYDKRRVIRESYDSFLKYMKEYLVYMHDSLHEAVTGEPLLTKAPIKQLLEKAKVSDGFRDMFIISASCTPVSCEVILTQKSFKAEYCYPLGELNACAGRISGPAGKGVITVSDLVLK